MKMRIEKIYFNKFWEAGFTILELLVVMSVVAALAGVSISMINPLGQYKKAQDAQRKADIAAIQAALEQYRADHSSYPPASSMSTCGIALTGVVNSTTVTYLSKIPCDPTGRSNINYFYDLDTSGNYCLRACLDNTSDKMSDFNTYGYEPANSCGSIYNCSYPGSYTVVPQ